MNWFRIIWCQLIDTDISEVSMKLKMSHLILIMSCFFVLQTHAQTVKIGIVAVQNGILTETGSGMIVGCRVHNIGVVTGDKNLMGIDISRWYVAQQGGTGWTADIEHH